MTNPSFTAVSVDELPKPVRVNAITDEDRATANAVAAILAAGQAARASATFDTKRKATDAGVKLVGLLRRLANADPAFGYRGKAGTQTLTLKLPDKDGNGGSFTYAIKPKAEEPVTPEQATAQAEADAEAAAKAAEAAVPA